MSIRGKIKRLGLIIVYIERNYYPSKQELLAYLTDEGFSTSSRTLDRDIEAIRDEFWLKIVYDRMKNGYYLLESNNDHTSTLLKIFNLVKTTDILVDNLQYGKGALEHIEFDGSDDLKGIEQLSELLSSIRKGKEIIFKYKNYFTEEEREINLKPLLLKEYHKRWYIIGFNDYVNDYRTYGIDRMTDLKTSSKSFKASHFKSPKELFVHTVGLTNTPDQPEIIKIRFTKEQARYIQTLPLHHSQEIESETTDGIVMSYYVIPNFEFKQKIIMQMGNAVVLKPQTLAEEIKGIAQNITANYSKGAPL